MRHHQLMLQQLRLSLYIGNHRLKLRREELPVENLALDEHVEQLIEGLEYGRPIRGHAGELTLQAVEQGLDGPVVDGAQVDGGLLRHVDRDVVHSGNEEAEGVGQGTPQALAVLHSVNIQKSKERQT